jgi:hypothetical protein
VCRLLTFMFMCRVAILIFLIKFDGKGFGVGAVNNVIPIGKVLQIVQGTISRSIKKLKNLNSCISIQLVLMM